MRVLITGGNGHVGSAVTRHFVQLGWDVRVFDLEAGASTPGTEYVQGDILNFDAVRAAVRGCDSVIHLAAIPRPSLAPGQEVFQVNTAGTFNIFEAAVSEGIPRIAQASSINAIGCAWSLGDIVTEYFPIDEDHPRHPADPYSFSKKVIEDIGDYYWRRDGITSFALRFPWVWAPTPGHVERIRSRRANDAAFLDAFTALPPQMQQEQLADVRQRALAFRAERHLEWPKAMDALPQVSLEADPLYRLFLYDRFNFWALVDARDAALAFEKALVAEAEGSHPLFINAAQNWLGCDTKTLLDIFYPGVPHKRTIRGDESLLSIERARMLIGFTPVYTPAALAATDIQVTP